MRYKLTYDYMAQTDAVIRALDAFRPAEREEIAHDLELDTDFDPDDLTDAFAEPLLGKQLGLANLVRVCTVECQPTVAR